MRSTFTFNGHTSDEFGIYIQRKPDLNRSDRKYKSADVPGRNGKIYQFQNAWNEVVVSYEIFAGGPSDGDAVTSFTDIVEWLNSADDYAVLTDTYDPTHYRMAVYVDDIDIESMWHTFGKATVKFRCRPQRYIVQTPVAVSSGGTITNNTNHVALPIITLTGNQTFPNLLDLSPAYDYTDDLANVMWNDLFLTNIGFQIAKQVTDHGEQRYAIFTYKQATASANGGTLTTHVNSSGTLTFTPFRINSEDIGIGRGVKLTPDTNYTLSCTTTSGNSKVQVLFYNSESPKYVNSIAEATRSGAGSLTLSFHTPVTCENAVIIFYRTSNTAGTFSSIMLNSGETAKPFAAYGAESSAIFAAGGVTLSFRTQGFSTAVIDCERENFTIDGVNANNKAMILDVYGNLSDKYLQLNEGSNTVIYSNVIASASFEPRFWEL